MKLSLACAGLALCTALAGCTIPKREPVEIAESTPSAAASVSLPPPAVELRAAPSVIAAPAVEPAPSASRIAAPTIDKPAAVRQRRIPTYPAALAEEGVEGQVIAEFYVGVEGTVEDLRIERSPHPLLSKAVAEALRGWRFDPARSADGRAVRSRMRLPFRFQVE